MSGRPRSARAGARTPGRGPTAPASRPRCARDPARAPGERTGVACPRILGAAGGPDNTHDTSDGPPAIVWIASLSGAGKSHARRRPSGTTREPPALGSWAGVRGRRGRARGAGGRHRRRPGHAVHPAREGQDRALHRIISDGFVAGLPTWTGGPRDHRGQLETPGAPLALTELVARFDTWVRAYNAERPHRSL